ncbi:MAG TPA: molybdate ABC transporter substrate-binding protein [Vicinamibacterales bacterium]|nr:molybdate ABC transporter substrate-binding protein [Vicinamibacterales bacterium]
MALTSALARAGAVILIAAFTVALSSSKDSAQRPVRRDLLVAAAASLSGMAPQLTRAFHDATGIDLRFNFGGSNTLARQIVEGARVDAFVSADAAQMDVVERNGRLVEGTRVNVVGNQLVVIVGTLPDPAAFELDDLGSPRTRRVAMGDPAAVPAGVYGRQWLEAVRLWTLVEPKVVPLPTSPAVVAAVRAGRAEFGVVYASDAWNRRDVSVAYVVRLEDAPEISYPAAVITGGRIPLARQFVDFLRSAPAQRIFESAGFRAVGAR